MLFEQRRRYDASREDHVFKSRRESFDLILDSLGHVEAGAVGHVAIGPRRMLSVGSTRIVEQARLGQQNERALRMFPSCRCKLRITDLLERSTQMDRSSLRAIGIPPRDGPAQGPIQFEDTGAVSISLKSLPVRSGQPVAGNREQAPGTQVAKGDCGLRQFVEIADTPAGGHFAAERSKIRREGVRNALRSATRDGPTRNVSCRAEHQTDGRRGWPVERQHRMRCETGEQSATLLWLERAAR